jgi:hypothetical protein
MFQGWFIDA